MNELHNENIKHLKERLHFLITKAHENHNNTKNYDILVNSVIIDFYDLTYSAIKLLEKEYELPTTVNKTNDRY